MPSNDVLILITGEKLTGWKTVNLTKSLDKLSGKFELSMVNEVEFLTFVDTQRISQVFIGDDKILTGYIDKINPDISKDSSIIVINGRETTADLIDCSAINKPGTWNNTTFERVLKDLLTPNGETFNIDLVINADVTKKLSKFSINTGDTVFDVISKLCGIYNVVPITNADGQLVIVGGEPGNTVDTLVLGENLLNINGSTDFTNRFSNYTVKGNLTNKGSGWSKSNVSIFGEATDNNIERFRPLQIKANENVDNALAKDRAAWEAQIRAGQSQTATAIVSEWRQSDGTLWDVNKLVPVVARPAKIDDEMLITNISFTIDNDNGRVSILQLAPPDIFKPNPESLIVKTNKKTGWS